MDKKNICYIAGVLLIGALAAKFFWPASSAQSFAQNNQGNKGQVQRQAPDVTAYDKWNLVCNQANKDNAKSCRVFQRIDEKNQTLLAISFVTVPVKDKVVTLMRIVTPLGVNLMTRMGFAIDDQKPGALAYKSCSGAGCFVLVQLKDDDIAKIKASNTLHVIYQGAQANAKPITIAVPMKGFVKAYSALLANVTK